MTTRFDAVVAGTGMGGLTTGALLASRGFDTLMLEARKEVGGYMAEFHRGPYRFDAASSFLGETGDTGRIGRLLEEIGVRDQAEFAFVERNMRMCFGDREVETSRQPLREAILEAFPEQRRGFERFDRVIQGLGDHLVRLQELTGWKKILAPIICSRVFRYSRARLGDVADRELGETPLRALLTSLPATAPPSELSLLFASTVLSKSGLVGACYPSGGFGQFARLIADGARAGGAEIRTLEPLEAVEHDGERVRAVRTKKGERIETRALVAGFDPRVLLDMLEGPETPRIRAGREQASRFRYSGSAFLVYLGLDESVDWSREHFFTSIFESLDLEEFYREVGQGTLPERAVINVTFPGASGTTIEKAAPPTANILTPAPFDLFHAWREKFGQEGYEERKTAFADRLVERVCRYIPSLKGAVVLSDSASPLTLMEWSGNTRGAMFGLEATPDQFGHRRWPNTGLLKGLYFSGHYSRPSHGVVGACYSGWLAADYATRNL